MAICGGNGMGFCNPTVGLRVSGYATKGRMLPGGVTLIAQSGSAFSAFGYNDRRLKFNLCASTGRELATTTADYMDWALEQDATRVIGLFLESARDPTAFVARSEEHTSELQSLMRISYAVFRLKKKKTIQRA